VTELVEEINRVTALPISMIEQGEASIVDGMVAVGAALSALAGDLERRDYPGVELEFLIPSLPVMVEVSDGVDVGCVSFNESDSSDIAVVGAGACERDPELLEYIGLFLGGNEELLTEIFASSLVSALELTLRQVAAILAVDPALPIGDALDSVLPDDWRESGDVVYYEEDRLLEVFSDGSYACGDLSDPVAPSVVAGRCRN
jgi:hypothetical protein